MTTAFPTAIDDFQNPLSSTAMNGGGTPQLNHAGQHTNTNDAIEAIEAVIGITGSTDTNSIQYKIAALQVPQDPGVTSFNNATGAITLNSTHITDAGGSLIDSPTFTGDPRAPTPDLADNDTSIATTAFVHNVADTAAAGVIPAQAGKTDNLLVTDGTSLSWSPTTSVIGPYVETRILEAFDRLRFYFDGELGSDDNDGKTTATPFKTVVGLKRRIQEGHVVAASADRQSWDLITGAGRTEPNQYWVLTFKTGLELSFKNTTTAGAIQAYTINYSIYSTLSMSVTAYSINSGDFSNAAGPLYNKLPKLRTAGYYINYHPETSNGGGNVAPYLVSLGGFRSQGPTQFWNVDVATPQDRMVAEGWSINSSNFETYNSNTVAIAFAGNVSAITTESGLSVEQQNLVNFRYQNASGAVPTTWVQAIQWCEAGQLYSTVLGAICPTRFSNLYANPHMSWSAGRTLDLHYCILRLRDGGATGAQYYGFTSGTNTVTLYQTNIYNERTVGSTLKGTIFPSADAKSRLDVIWYVSTAIGFSATYGLYDALTDLTYVNMQNVGLVNTSTGRLYYPNMHISVS